MDDPNLPPIDNNTLSQTHKIIWYGDFLDGKLTVLTERGVSKESNGTPVICVVQGMDIEFSCQALAENTQVGLEKLIEGVTLAYKSACAEEMQDLVENYGLKPN